MRLSRLMRGTRFSWVVEAFMLLLQSISDAQQRERMRLGRTSSVALRLFDTLLYGKTGDGTIGADVIGIVLSHLPKYRPPYLHRGLEEDRAAGIRSEEHTSELQSHSD